MPFWVQTAFAGDMHMRPALTLTHSMRNSRGTGPASRTPRSPSARPSVYCGGCGAGAAAGSARARKGNRAQHRGPERKRGSHRRAHAHRRRGGRGAPLEPTNHSDTTHAAACMPAAPRRAAPRDARWRDGTPSAGSAQAASCGARSDVAVEPRAAVGSVCGAVRRSGSRCCRRRSRAKRGCASG